MICYPIEINNLCKSYRNKAVLKNFNLRIKSNLVYGLVGNNGVGKSTLLKCISGVEQINSGRIIIDGKDIEEYGRELYNVIGMQFQELYYQEKIKVSEYCKMFSSIYDTHDYAEELIDLFELCEIKNMPVKDLSGGQKQILGLITTLLGKPKILLLDETTSGMDTKNIEKCLNKILDYKKKTGCTVIFVTHDYRNILNLANRIIWMKENYEVKEFNMENMSNSERANIIEQIWMKKSEC